MFNILSDQGGEFEACIKGLDHLVYKNKPDINESLSVEKDGNAWQTLEHEVSVRVWEDKAKIKVKVSPGKQKNYFHEADSRYCSACYSRGT